MSRGFPRGAALGVGFYSSAREAFRGLARKEIIDPDPSRSGEFRDHYGRWKEALDLHLARRVENTNC